jgi:hypothetical protein
MNSLIMICHGVVPGRRQGRSRALPRYQRSTRRTTSRRSAEVNGAGIPSADSAPLTRATLFATDRTKVGEPAGDGFGNFLMSIV